MAKTDRTLDALFETPTRTDVRWSELEALMRALAFDKHQGSGSRVTFEHEEGFSITLHKPHPRNELKRYQVKQIRTFLEEQGLVEVDE